MLKPLFLLVALASGASAQLLMADANEARFNRAVEDINASVKKIVTAQAALAKEKTAAAKGVVLHGAPKCTPAQADQAYGDLKRCEDVLRKQNVSVRDAQNGLVTGFNREGYSLVLLTTSAAYFYHEDCDICAAVDKCDLKTGVVTDFKTAHSVDCSDLRPEMKPGTVVMSSCK